MILALVTAATVAALIPLIPFWLTWLNMTPFRGPESGPRPSDYGLETETLDVIAPDGVLLKAWLVRGETNAPLVVVVHGKGNSKMGMLNYARPLHKAGFHVLLPDLRGHGESGDARITMGLREADDVRLCVEAACRRPGIDTTRIGVHGQSMGTAAAILGLCDNKNVRGFFLDSGFAALDDLMVDVGVHVYGVPRWIAAMGNPSYHLLSGTHPSAVRPAECLARLNVPCFFYHATDDRTIPIRHGRALFDAAKGKKAMVTSAGDHVASWGANPEKFEKHLVDFFRGVFADPEFDPISLAR